ncbi:FAS1-like dehydratase domain-containing protein [Nocardia aurantiaca]|uniref:FAS1-like dehydratase domain-containing protein n=1 Tax=Nocardia aurantiaca TaxID=2675850 RepID=A0A6I3KWY4_9NOCA|nr:MaoC family dehydratase N-terminal domain-containing protein [Nocardia aurantiaca]MTE13388.1 hypothetical protein [Nocardia aurantiaca]
MAVNPNAIGIVHPMATMTLDPGRSTFFVKTIGETNPIFTDESAAAEAGYRPLPVPPVELEHTDPCAWITAVGVDLRRILHGEKEFACYSTAYAGESAAAASTSRSDT